jgi:hypothetical protein
MRIVTLAVAAVIGLSVYGVHAQTEDSAQLSHTIKGKREILFNQKLVKQTEKALASASVVPLTPGDGYASVRRPGYLIERGR